MRVAMAVALFRRPDVLILDEPTNHLDKETVNALCESIKNFEGTVLAVSHDEGFVSKILKSDERCGEDSHREEAELPRGQLWVLANQRLERFEGNFRDYRNKIARDLSK